MTNQRPPWPLIPDSIALAAGRFLAAASLMDSLMEKLVWHLLGRDPVELRPLTWALNVGKKREMIQHLLPIRKASPEAMDAWEEAKPLISKVSENRNWTAHGVWWPVPAGYFRTHKGTIGTLKTLNEKEIERWIKDARDAVEQLEKLFDVPSP